MIDTQPPLRIATRFTRSIHLQRDFADSGLGLSGYQVTPLVLQMLGRVLSSLHAEGGDRAFSVIGPYGAGKSAFGVFLATYLNYDHNKRTSVLSAQRTDTPDPVLIEGPTLLPVLVSGNNSALRPAILQALYQTLSGEARIRDKHPALLEELQAANHDLMIDPQRVAVLIERGTSAVIESQIAEGLLLVVDELGQYLNHIAHHGDERDLFVLQTLAEAAVRSGAQPFLIVTILHQSFDRYTASAGPTRRTEWAKIQGRFAELPFEEPASQMLRMVGRALWPDDIPLPTWRRDWGIRLGTLTDVLGLRPVEISAVEWNNLISQAYPLHPTTLAALPLLFRQLAQNERSLFAFLSASEPWGLQDFMIQAGRNKIDRPVYRLPQLYEYVETNLGGALFGRARGQRWAELAEARTRLGDTAGLAHETLTAIGTLSALGQSRGLRADHRQLAFALCDDPDNVQVKVALRLLEERRLITYRNHRQSFQIWEGSDLDLDDLVVQTRREIDNQVSLVDLLTKHATPSPLVARRFSYETGAPRLFAARFIDAADLLRSWIPPTNVEGEVLYIVASDGEALAAAEYWATTSERVKEPLRIAVLPEHADGLRELALEVAALDHVLIHQPALEHDRAARREVVARLAEAKQALTELISYVYSGNRGRWFWHAVEQRVPGARAVDTLLSTACSTAYPYTPRIWNELIVRRQLSSAAARARRTLIEAMLDRGHEERLGLTGFPPERAIYESLFTTSGIHRPADDGYWYFDAPPENDLLHLRPVWDAIEEFFASSSVEARPLLDLHQLLEAPPYGVKPGLIPLLFVAAYLANSGEIALYEHGSYAPTPDMPLFERMLRQPRYFGVRRTQVSGVRVAVFERLARAMAPKALLRNGHPALLDAVTPLLRFVHTLPSYARSTKQVSERAQAIRAALLNARAPDELLFESLPRSCNVDPFDTATPADENTVEQFFSRLRAGLEELRAAYDTLRDRVTTRIAETFHATASTPLALHDELATRYARIASLTSDTQLRAFGVRVEHGEPDGGWIESVAALVGHKPLDTWSDSEAMAFDLHIADLGRRFRLAEQIALAAAQLPPDTPVLRIAVADAREEKSMVIYQQQVAPQVGALHAELSEIMRKHQSLSRQERASAVATLLKTLLSEE